MDVSTIGLDIAKSVFQLHGIDAAGEVVVRRRLRRGRLLGFFENLGPCLVGIEACATAHYWGREIAALGHEVRLMPAHYVKAYVKRGKNDAAMPKRSARRFNGRRRALLVSRAQNSRAF
jgi:transposase